MYAKRDEYNPIVYIDQLASFLVYYGIRNGRVAGGSSFGSLPDHSVDEPQ